MFVLLEGGVGMVTSFISFLRLLAYDGAVAKPHALKLKRLLAEYWVIRDSKSVNMQGLETTAVK